MLRNFVLGDIGDIALDDTVTAQSQGLVLDHKVEAVEIMQQ